MPPLACQRILIGAVCLFRAGRNDSGEENVPLDLTRGNAGRRGRRRGRARCWGGAGGCGPGPVAGAGPARDRRGCGRQSPSPACWPARAKPGAASRDPSPFPVPASLAPRLSPGLGVRRVLGNAKRDSAEPATLWVLWTPEEAFNSGPGARAAIRLEAAGRGCYLGCRRCLREERPHPALPVPQSRSRTCWVLACLRDCFSLCPLPWGTRSIDNSVVKPRSGDYG